MSNNNVINKTILCLYLQLSDTKNEKKVLSSNDIIDLLDDSDDE